jgi:hypothetical protein
MTTDRQVSIDAIKELSQDSTRVRLNTDLLKSQKIHICMPCYGGMVTESTFLSFIRFSNTARQLGLDWSIETTVNESLVPRARNTLVSKFLTATDATHLMFIDADIGWESWHLLLLMNHDLDVVGGLYPMKSLPLKWVVNKLENGETRGDLLEVSKAGTGFLLIKREVFHKLKQHPDVKHYNNDIGVDAKFDAEMYNFFDTTIRDNRYYSEDYTFCENWRQMGGKIFVDKRIVLKHAGYFNYSLSEHEKLVEEYGKIYLKIHPQTTDS